jgi:RHS repeat-associated protein
MVVNESKPNSGNGTELRPVPTLDVWFDDIEVVHTEALIVQETHYDPFGLELAGIEKRGRPEHEFKYNGKELIEELGLNWNDYGARNYDAQLGRWSSMDALAEDYYSLSPYTYVANNPLSFINPDGKRINVSELLKSKEGLYVLMSTMLELSQITGLAFSVSAEDGMLKENSNDKRPDSEKGGDGESRSYVRVLINDKSVISVTVNQKNSKGENMGTEVV